MAGEPRDDPSQWSPSIRSTTIRAIGSSTAATIAVNAIQLVQSPVLARLLDPVAFGLANIVFVWVSLAQGLGELGLQSAAVQRRNLAKEVLSSLFWLNVFAACALTLALWLLSSPLGWLYDEPALRGLFIAVAPLFVLAAVGYGFRTVLERELAFTRIGTADVGGAAVAFVVATVTAAASHSATSIVWGTLAGAAGRTALLLASAVRRWRPSLTFDFAAARPFLRFGLALTGQRVVNYFSASLDFVLIGLILSPRSLGFYALAYNVANIPSARINASFGAVLFPALSKIHDEPVRLRAAYLEVQRYTAIVNAPLCAGLAVSAPVAIEAVLGDAWSPAARIMQILAVVGLTRGLAGTAGPLLLAAGRPGLGFRWSLLVFAIQGPAIVAGIMIGGAVGVAIAFALAQLVVFGLNYFVLIRTLLGPTARLYIASMTPGLVAAGMMALLIIALRPFTASLAPVPQLLAEVLVGAAFYGLVLTTIFRPTAQGFMDMLRGNRGADAS